MFESVCLVHYHEIGLKGKNRSTFENQLVTNLKRALRAFPVAGVSRISGYIVVETEDHRATGSHLSGSRSGARISGISLWS